MSRTRRVLSGVGLGYVNQALALVVGLWVTRLLLATLGQYDYGLWLVGIQVLAYLALLDLGVVAVLPRNLAYVTGRAQNGRTTGDVRELVGETIRLTLWQLPVVALASGALWIVLPREWEALRSPLGLVILAFVGTFPLRVFPAALSGLQDLSFLAVAQLVSWATSTGVLLALVWGGLGLYALAAAWLAGQVALVAACWLRLRTRFPEVWPWPLPRFSLEAARGLLRRSTWVSVSQVAHALLAATDVLIIGKILGPEAVVPYVCTGKLASLLAHQPQMLLHTAQPGLAELRAGAPRERILRAATALTSVVLLFSGGLLCVTLAINHGFVVWWVGENQWGGWALTVLVVTRVVVQHWLMSLATVIFCFGYERRLAMTAGIEGIVIVGASALLIARIGPLGAPLGALAGHVFVSMPAHLSVLGRELGGSAQSLLQSLWPWTWRFLIFAAIVSAAGELWTPRSVPKLALAALLAAITYGALMLPVALSGPVRDYVHPNVSRILMKFRHQFRAAPEA